MCERKLIDTVCEENAAALFLQADQYNAQRMRDHCLQFICNEFDCVSKTPAFEELCVAHGELVFEVLKRR